jgi:predicted dehydrogenase
MNKINIGVIGTGHLGKLHIKMLKQMGNVNISGIFDSSHSQLIAASEEYNVPIADSLESLIEASDALSIAVSTTAHHEIAMQCLLAGRHIFIEKPITATIPQGEELVKLAKEKNLTIQVGHIERFNPALLAVDEYIESPLFIQSDRLAQFNPRGTDVAVVLDLMIHDIDIILSLVKSDVVKVDANGVAVVSGSIDIANARLQFANGAVANVTASRISQKKMRKMRLFQRENYISLDFITGVSEVYRLIPLQQESPGSSISFGEIGVGEKKKKVIYEQPEIKEVNALHHELKMFADCIQENKRPVVTGEDGLNALKVAEIIIQKIGESNIYQ